MQKLFSMFFLILAATSASASKNVTYTCNEKSNQQKEFTLVFRNGDMKHAIYSDQNGGYGDYSFMSESENESILLYLANISRPISHDLIIYDVYIESSILSATEIVHLKKNNDTFKCVKSIVQH